MGVKRGYHVHMRPKGNATLSLPVLDADIGYLIAPMARGIRMTSGAEFAHRDSIATPLQLDRVEPYAKALFPLEGRVEAQPWKGARPCMPDMLCVLGKAPRHKGLWFDFGHAHHGLTLAGSSARLLGEMITGETPFTDPAPYSLARFN
jgi:D-amino-acid dehydrogenase